MTPLGKYIKFYKKKGKKKVTKYRFVFNKSKPWEYRWLEESMQGLLVQLEDYWSEDLVTIRWAIWSEVVAAILDWSSSSTTTWKSICFESSLDSRLSASSSSSLLTFPYSLAWASTIGSSGRGTRSILLKGSSMALNISIQPSMNLNFRA